MYCMKECFIIVKMSEYEDTLELPSEEGERAECDVCVQGEVSLFSDA